MKFYLYFDDDVFTHIFDIEEVRLSNENLYNKIMKQNFYIGNWNELVLSNDFEYKSVYEIESNYTKEQLKQENAQLKDKLNDIEKILDADCCVENIYQAICQYLNIHDYGLDLEDYLKEN